MKKLFVMMLGATLAAHALADGKLLVFATDGNYPPFSEMASDGQMTGFDIDIGKALCAQMQRECRFEQLDWEGLIPALKTNKVDVILASMNDTPERRQSIAFTDPYYKNPGLFVRPAGSKTEPTAEGVKGKVVGVLRASIFDNYATAKFPDADIQRFTSQEDANAAAVAGRVDLLFADKIVMDDFLRHDDGKGFEAAGETEDPEYFGAGIAIGVRKDDNQLREELNAALKAIQENGAYKKVNDQYFPYDVSAHTPQ
ncbi:transporter substrate-binding domain-containing protein [Cardiobacterium hominis]|uniref:transporter substrate-binding domain-containing protein n=1 Tax=Cardiobacterium hominis TaxID=2718 RepID=UPI0028ECF150|nr:transporter substrate-binding domain-containing protein [Cardiobacterium hominis]